jgi:hypothetical protein
VLQLFDVCVFINIITITFQHRRPGVSKSSQLSQLDDPEDSLHGANVNGADDNEGTLVNTKIVPENIDKVSFIL